MELFIDVFVLFFFISFVLFWVSKFWERRGVLFCALTVACSFAIQKGYCSSQYFFSYFELKSVTLATEYCLCNSSGSWYYIELKCKGTLATIWTKVQNMTILVSSILQSKFWNIISLEAVSLAWICWNKLFLSIIVLGAFWKRLPNSMDVSHCWRPYTTTYYYIC